MPDLVNIGDRDLFGNQVAEDEDEDIFHAYALDRDELATFADPLRRLSVVRAYKGEGKSALLRLAAARLKREDAALVVSTAVTAIAPDLHSDDFDTWVRAWKSSIFSLIAQQVGSKLGVAWSDDAIGLVEEAEKSGARPRGIIGSIVDRLKPKVSATGVEISLDKIGLANAESTVSRWAKDGTPVWVLVDDVDYNFENTPRHRVKVASFFVACRQAVNAVPELRLRAAVRPNVWTTLKLHFESLSHVEQYILDLRWDLSSMSRLLAQRVRGYLVRRDRWRLIEPQLPRDPVARDNALIAEAFESPVRWGRENATRPPIVMLHTLSKHRPRWLVELCSAAAARAVADSSPTQILQRHVLEQLADFGRRRLVETVAEFRSQCPEVEELLSAFHQAPEELSTDELLSLIQRKVLNHLSPRIAGVVGPPSSLAVAAFLFEIGVFFARRDFPDGSYEHVTYLEMPSLLRSRTNVDGGMRWEVHPVFRQALEIRDGQGREPVRRGRGRRQ